MTNLNSPDRSICLDCQVDTFEIGHYYMVHDHVWALTGLAKDDGQLCLDCLEARIGRELTRYDFTNAPINYFIHNY